MRLLDRLDARAFIALASFILVLVVLGMVALWPFLLKVDAFLILATAIVITGWVQGPVGWAYQATKTGGELADANARILGDQAGKPQEVEIRQPANRPVPTTDVIAPARPAPDPGQAPAVDGSTAVIGD